MNNNEKEFIVTKIEKYSEEMKESEEKIVQNAIFAGASAVAVCIFIEKSILSGYLNIIPALVSTGVGSMMIYATNIMKQMARQTNLREELVDDVMNSLQNNNQEIENKGKSR